MEFPAVGTLPANLDTHQHLSRLHTTAVHVERGQIPSEPGHVHVVDGLGADRCAAGSLLPEWLRRVSATGSAKRLVQLLVALDVDPEANVVRVDGGVVIERRDLRRRSIADRCGVRSEGTVGEWLSRWADKGWLVHGRVDLDRLAMDLGVVTPETPRVPQPAPAVVAPGAVPSMSDAVLPTLLDHLERAHAQGLHNLAMRLERWVDELLSAEPFEGPRVTASPADGSRGSAVDIRDSAVLSREVGSSLFNSGNSSTSLDSTGTREVDRVRGDRPADLPRSRAEFTELIEPLSRLVRERSLTGMRRSGGVEQALREYSDDQVKQAVKAMCRMVRSDDSIRSPFGLLVRFARDGNPDVFTASVPSFHEPLFERPFDASVSEPLERQLLVEAVRAQRNFLRQPDTPVVD